MHAPMPDFRKLQLISDVNDLIGDVDQLLARVDGDTAGAPASRHEQVRKSLERARASLRHVEATMAERGMHARRPAGNHASAPELVGLQGSTFRLLHGLMHR